MEKKAENRDLSKTAEEKTTQESEIQNLITNLPKERDSDGTYLSFFQGFWCPTTAITNVIAFQQHFQPHHTDLIVASFPKSGTTWLKALAFAIVNRTTKQALAQSPLLSANPHQLVPSLEQQIYEQSPSVYLKDIPSPRILSTHVPYAALPMSVTNSDCRLVYICRNPMDNFISYWHFGAKLWSQNNYSVSLDECFGMFCSGVSTFGPFWDHILGYWKASQEKPDKVLFLKYEDLKEDIVFQTKLLAEFLGCPFSMEEERDGVVEEVARLCSFDNLKDLKVNKTGKQSTGHVHSDFFRKGEVGDWSNYLTPLMTEQAKKLIQAKIEGSGLTFKMS